MIKKKKSEEKQIDWLETFKYPILTSLHVNLTTWLLQPDERDMSRIKEH